MGDEADVLLMKERKRGVTARIKVLKVCNHFALLLFNDFM